MIRWPADRAGPAWLWPAAGAAALLAHLALVLLLWDRPVLTPAGGGGGDGVRISLAPLGRGMPVGLAPAAPAAPAADAAASQADAGQADLPPAGTDGAAPADSPPAARQPDARTAGASGAGCWRNGRGIALARCGHRPAGIARGRSAAASRQRARRAGGRGAAHCT